MGEGGGGGAHGEFSLQYTVKKIADKGDGENR